MVIIVSLAIGIVIGEIATPERLKALWAKLHPATGGKNGLLR